jgi:hypothetical protein
MQALILLVLVGIEAFQKKLKPSAIVQDKKGKKIGIWSDRNPRI